MSRLNPNMRTAKRACAGAVAKLSFTSVPSARPGLRAGRVVLLVAAALVALVIAGIWVLPGMLDWNRYRGSIASLAADSGTGTVSAAGTGTAFGRSWRFTARLGRPGRDGAAPLDVSLDGQGKLQDTGGTFSGVLGADGALAGRVAGRGPDLSQL